MSLSRKSLAGCTAFVAGCAVLFGVASDAGAASLPYYNDFSTSVDDFNGSYASNGPAVNNWTLVTDGSGNGLWQHEIVGPGSNQSLVTRCLSVSGVAGNDFVMSSDFIVVTRDTDWSSWTVGFGLLASSASQDIWTSNTYYNVSVNMAASQTGSKIDSLAIGKSNGGSGLDLGRTELSSNLTEGSAYRLSVEGTYTPSGLVLTAVLSDSEGVLATVQSEPDASPYSGSWFGYRNSGAWSEGGIAQFDNFSLVVPEPTSLALVGLMSLGLLVRARKSA